MENIACYYKILENIIFSKQPKIEFFKWYADDNFKKFIDEFLPEIKNCYKQEQKSVWHLYNVLEHTFVALEKANELCESFTYEQKKVVLLSVFFHDIGKPYVVVEKVDKNGNIYHGFPKHNLKSVEIFTRVKDVFNLTKNQEIVIVNLILNHDTFNDEDRLIDINLYFEKQNQISKVIDKSDVDFYFKSLVIVAKSDNFAQNRQKTKPTLNKILAFEKLLK